MSQSYEGGAHPEPTLTIVQSQPNLVTGGGQTDRWNQRYFLMRVVPKGLNGNLTQYPTGTTHLLPHLHPRCLRRASTIRGKRARHTRALLGAVQVVQFSFTMWLPMVQTFLRRMQLNTALQCECTWNDNNTRNPNQCNFIELHHCHIYKYTLGLNKKNFLSTVFPH